MPSQNHSYWLLSWRDGEEREREIQLPQREQWRGRSGELNMHGVCAIFVLAVRENSRMEIVNRSSFEIIYKVAISAV